MQKDFFGRVKNKAGDMEKILKEKDKHGLFLINFVAISILRMALSPSTNLDFSFYFSLPTEHNFVSFNLKHKKNIYFHFHFVDLITSSLTFFGMFSKNSFWSLLQQKNKKQVLEHRCPYNHL